VDEITGALDRMYIELERGITSPIQKRVNATSFIPLGTSSTLN
jgi:hypothetical protein